MLNRHPLYQLSYRVIGASKRNRTPIIRLEISGITLGFQPNDGGSIPLTRSRSPIAQLVEQLTVNQSVAGSSPARGAMLTVAQSVELQIVVLAVASSILVCQPTAPSFSPA